MQIRAALQRNNFLRSFTPGTRKQKGHTGSHSLWIVCCWWGQVLSKKTKPIPSHRPDPRASYPRASYPRASCPGARLPAASRAQDGYRQFEFVLVEKMLHGARHSSASSTLKRGFFETQKLAPLVCSPVQHQWILMTSSTMTSL